MQHDVSLICTLGGDGPRLEVLPSPTQIEWNHIPFVCRVKRSRSQPNVNNRVTLIIITRESERFDGTNLLFNIPVR